MMTVKVEQNSGFCFEESSDVIPSVAIDQILAHRKQGIDCYMQGLALLQQAHKHLETASGGSIYINFENSFHSIRAAIVNGSGEVNSHAIKRDIDAKIWQRLMIETGMITFMTSGQRSDWHDQLGSDVMPEVTLDNVLTSFQELHKNKKQNFEYGVIELFRSLSWNYATNSPCKIGNKIIIESMISTCKLKRPSANSKTVAQLDDLMKVHCLLDGKPILDHRVGAGEDFRQFVYDNKFTTKAYENEYFTIRYFKKGSCHIKFQREDIIVKMNDILANHYPDAIPSRL